MSTSSMHDEGIIELEVEDLEAVAGGFVLVGLAVAIYKSFGTDGPQLSEMQIP